MKTEIFKIDPEQIDYELIQKAADIILSGGVVAFPTETVYGLGANALDGQAVGRIFTAKGRPQDNPLIVHVSSIKQVETVVSHIPGIARKLMDAFWPGPLTLVMEKSELVPTEVNAGLDTVAVRMPSHPVALALIEASGVPVAAPSANLSGRPSTTSADHVLDDLRGRIPAVIDSGSSSLGLESTVLDVIAYPPAVLRPGGITLENILEITGEAEVSGDTEEVPRSPGMKYTHYSPNARVIIVSGDPADVVRKINEMASDFERDGAKVGILATRQTVSGYTGSNIIVVGDRTSPDTIASNLFNAFREFDRMGASVVLAESVDERGLGLAIMNRMNKASGYNIIHAGSEV